MELERNKMIKIGYEIEIVVDEVKTEFKDSYLIVRDALACDINGNSVEGYSKRNTRMPFVTITHNNESVSLKDLNTAWIEYCKELPFKASFIGIGNNSLTFSNDVYTKNQFDLVCEEIPKFLRKYFYFVFDFNEVN
jgi:hypothetical protein